MAEALPPAVKAQSVGGGRKTTNPLLKLHALKYIYTPF